MKLDKTHLIVFLVGVILGLVAGFFVGKGIYDQPLEENITRDTVIVYDTIPHYYPKPVDSAVVRYVTKVLPVTKYDTIHHFRDVTQMIHDTVHHVIAANNVINSVTDSVAVEIPITSKHYNAPEYDAWVSGFEPSLDSIKVYQRTEYITERVTISKPPNKWELDALAGIDYNITSQQYRPYSGGELMYKPNRLQVGIRGGIIKNDKAEPFVGAVVKYRLF